MAKFSRFDPRNKKQNRNKFLNQEKITRIKNTKITTKDQNKK